MKFTHEMIMCIVNAGYYDEVMKVAKQQGARGGTVISARGTANPEAEKFFNIAVQPEKDIVLIVVSSDIKEKLMKALYTEVGLDSPGQGIAFSLPIDSAVGLSKANAMGDLATKNEKVEEN
jgi:nitrogen regulatory protein PII